MDEEKPEPTSSRKTSREARDCDDPLLDMSVDELVHFVRHSHLPNKDLLQAVCTYLEKASDCYARRVDHVHKKMRKLTKGNKAKKIKLE